MGLINSVGQREKLGEKSVKQMTAMMGRTTACPPTPASGCAASRIIRRMPSPAKQGDRDDRLLVGSPPLQKKDHQQPDEQHPLLRLMAKTAADDCETG